MYRTRLDGKSFPGEADKSNNENYRETINTFRKMKKTEADICPEYKRVFEIKINN